MIDWLGSDLKYDIFAVFDVHFGRPPLTRDRFSSYRTYPFLAFNYLAYPRESALNPARSAKGHQVNEVSS